MAAGPGDGGHEYALRALARRDLSARELERRLADRGVGAAERQETLAALAQAGILDDRRFAEERARALAARGAGDALVRHELERAGVAAELVEEALAALPPERERAQALVARRGRGPRTARYLLRKGFAEEVVVAVAGGGARGELG